MSLLSVRKLTTSIEKIGLATDRAHQLAAIYARHGASARVSKVVAGDDAGQIYAGFAFRDGKSLGQVFETVQADPAYAQLMAERELNPAWYVSEAEIYRTVHGDLQGDFPMILERVYAISRDRLAGALVLLPELDALAQRHDVKVGAMTPLFSSDMARMVVVYYHRSVAHLGKVIDDLTTSAEFDSIAMRAAAFGTLTKSRVLATI